MHSLRNILPNEQKVEIAHAGRMNGCNGERQASTLRWQPQKVALRGPESKLGNLTSGNPERTLLGDQTRGTRELTAPTLPPKIGRRGKGGEDAPDLHQHPVGVGC